MRLALLVLVACGSVKAPPAPPPRVAPPAPPLDGAPVDAPASVTLPPLSPFTQPALAMRDPSCGTCSHGHCVTHLGIGFPDLESLCECDAGFFAHGDDCIACPALAGDQLDVAPKRAHIHGRITLGGKPLPADLPGKVVLVPTGMMYPPLELEREFDHQTIEGRYDVLYRVPGQWFPYVVVARDRLLRGDVRLDLDLPLQHVTGKLAFTGDSSAVPVVANLALTRGHEGVVIEVDSGAISAYVPRGPVDIQFYTSALPGPQTPALVQRNVRLKQPLDITIPVVRVTGTVTGLGAVAGKPVLVGLWSSDLPRSEWPPPPVARVADDGTFSFMAVRGPYDVMLHVELGDVTQSLRVAHDIEIGPKLDIAMPPLARVHGRLFVGDAPWPAHHTVRSGPLVIASGESDTWGYVKLPVAPDGTFDGLVPHGRYLLAYAREGEVGVTGVTPLERVSIDADLDWSYHLPLVDANTTVTIGGEPAGVALEAAGAHYPLAPGLRVPPGDYDVMWARDKLATAHVTGAPLVIDIPTRHVHGSTNPAGASPITAGGLELGVGPYERDLRVGSLAIEDGEMFLRCVTIK